MHDGSIFSPVLLHDRKLRDGVVVSRVVVEQMALNVAEGRFLGDPAALPGGDLVGEVDVLDLAAGGLAETERRSVHEGAYDNANSEEYDGQKHTPAWKWCGREGGVSKHVYSS